MSDGALTGVPKKKNKKGGIKMNWATYLHKIKNQVHPELGMASDAMFVVNGIVEDYKERLINASFAQATDFKSGTLKAKHGRCAAVLILEGTILKHTLTEGERACVNYAGAV